MAAAPVAASILQRYAYTAYGLDLGMASTPLTALRYAGQMIDPSTGLSFNRARWYDPSNGQWKQLDPLAGSINDPLSLHKYLYGNGNPISNVDPSGQLSTVEKLVVVGITGALFAILGNGLHNISNGKDFFDNWKTAAVTGAVLAPLAVTFPFLAVTLAGVGLGESLHNAMQVFGDPNSTATQQGAAIALVGLNIFGAWGSAKYGSSQKSLWFNAKAFAASGPTWAAQFQAMLRQTQARVAELAAAIPEGSRGRITMAFALAKDAAGNIVKLVGTSEDGGYLREGVREIVNLAGDEIVATGNGRHAEINIINLARALGLEIITIGATRPICPECAAAMGARGIPAATPLKNPLSAEVFPSLEPPPPPASTGNGP
jgi:RHS repeat-associated protein